MVKLQRVPLQQVPLPCPPGHLGPQRGPVPPPVRAGEGRGAPPHRRQGQADHGQVCLLLAYYLISCTAASGRRTRAWQTGCETPPGGRWGGGGSPVSSWRSELQSELERNRNQTNLLLRTRQKVLSAHKVGEKVVAPVTWYQGDRTTTESDGGEHLLQAGWIFSQKHKLAT